MAQNPRRWWRPLLTGIPLSVVLATTFGPPTSVGAQRQRNEAHVGQPAPRQPSGLQHAAAGLRAVIDPVTREKVTDDGRTGMLPATHLEALSQSLEGLTVVHRPDGSKHVDLQGRFMCGVIARTDLDGPRQYCVSSKEQADALLRRDAIPQIAPEVE